MLSKEDIKILHNRGIYPHFNLSEVEKESRKLTLSEFVESICSEYQLEIDKSIWTSKTSKRRAKFRKMVWEHLIKNDLLICPATGEKVSYCICDYVKLNGRYYYKFYSENDVEFSLDHKLPISKGGERKNFCNIQVMTREANGLKSDSLVYL